MLSIERLLLVAIAVAAVSATRCESPKFSATSYSTTDGFFHFQTAVIAEFSLGCSNNIKDLQLHAVYNRRTYIVASSEETSKYQVSVMLDHSEAAAHSMEIAIYDEEGFAAYKKDESTAPLFTISHNHAGLDRKWPVSSETVALLISLLGVYYAFSLKNSVN